MTYFFLQIIPKVQKIVRTWAKSSAKVSMWIYFIVFRAFVMYVAIHHCESVRARTQFELDRLLDEVNPEARM